MTKTLDQRLAELSPERQAKVAAHRQLEDVRAYRLRAPARAAAVVSG